MAVTSKTAGGLTEQSSPAQAPAGAQTSTPSADRENETRPSAKTDAATMGGQCVVDADFHVGRATPGSKVCSYHAMHYDVDGNRRGE